MKREENIFYNIIKNETSLTEVFCNFMQYKSFRDLFVNIVNEKRKSLNLEQLEGDSIKYDHFSTEKTLKDAVEEFGRGDLILRDKDSDYIFELKIRQYTKLTVNQPERYLRYLDNDDSKLFFIIPKGYTHINDIYTRWNNATGYSKEKIKNHIIFWEDILKDIRQKELDKLNLFIKEFCDILDYRWFDYPEIKFSNYEIELLFQEQKNKTKELLMLLDANVPKIISKLFKVVEEVSKKLEITKDDSKTDEYYGYILKNKNIPEKWEIWFGVDYEIWEQHSFPLTIQVYSDDVKEMEKIKSLDFLRTFTYEDKDKTTFIGLERDIFENKENNIIEVFVDKINEIVEKIKQS